VSGFYADYPNHRIAYHEDGTVVYVLVGSTPVLQTGAAVLTLNNEEDTGIAFDANKWVTFIFPEARTITHAFIEANIYAFNNVAVSDDTTTGLDGTWTTVHSTSQSSVNTSIPNYRIPGTASFFAITTPTSALAIRFLRTGSGGNETTTIHLFGTKTAAGNAMLLWQPSPTDARVTPGYFDFGDRRQGTNATKSFRVKNASATQTATDVVVSASDNGVGTLNTTLEFSTDNSTWFPTRTIASIAPGAISAVMYVRSTLPIDYTPLGVGYSAYIVANPTSMA